MADSDLAGLLQKCVLRLLSEIVPVFSFERALEGIEVVANGDAFVWVVCSEIGRAHV